MPRKPTGAAALLDGFAELLAHRLVKHALRQNMKPEPETDIETERQVRLLGVMARTALAIHKLDERETPAKERGDPEEADMDDRPDDPETIERKYVLLQARLAEYHSRADARRVQGEGAASVSGLDPDQLAHQGQRRAA